MNKRRNNIIQLAILVALAAAVALPLILPRMTEARVVATPLELSVILRDTDSSLWANARMGMEQAAAEHGVEMRFLTLTTQGDCAEQEELLRREAEGDTDMLVIAPADTQRLSRQLRELVGQRTVVSVESELEGAELSVLPDNAALGHALAQTAMEDWSGGTVLLLNTAPESSGVLERLEAVRQTLAGHGVPVCEKTVKISELTGALHELVQESGAVQIMAFEPAASECAAAGKESAQLSQPLYGVGSTTDIAAWLERGTICAVAAWSEYAAGYLAVEGAALTTRGETYKMEPLPFSMVRGEEIYDPDNQKLLFPVTY